MEHEKPELDLHEISASLKESVGDSSFCGDICTMMSPINSKSDTRGYEWLGFETLNEYLTSSTGLGVAPKVFVSALFAWRPPENKVERIFRHLIEVEKWAELRKHLPAEWSLKLGLKGAKHGEVGNGRSRGDNVTSTDRGNSAKYIGERLAKDAETDPKIADIYQRLREGVISSANKAAIEAGYKKEQFSSAKDPEKIAAKLKKEFSKDEIKQLMEMLNE